MLVEAVSVVVAGLALGLSTFTTYLAYFDRRVTLTAAVDKVRVGVQSSASRSDGRVSRTFRYFPVVSFILATRRGTRSLMITDIELVRGGTRRGPRTKAQPVGSFEPVLAGPGLLQHLSLEFELPRAESTGASIEELTFEPRSETWSLQFTIFDPKGHRREPMLVAFEAILSFERTENGFESSVTVDFPRHARTVLSTS